MTADVVILVSIGAVVFAAAWALSAYLRMRRISNRFLALATKEFHEAAGALTEDLQELPIEVISLLQTMNKTAFARGSDRTFLAQLEAAGAVRQATPPWLKNLPSGTRGHLLKAAASWMNIMTHRHTIVGTRIGMEIVKHQVNDGRIPANTGKQSILALFSLKDRGGNNGASVA